MVGCPNKTYQYQIHECWYKYSLRIYWNDTKNIYKKTHVHRDDRDIGHNLKRAFRQQSLEGDATTRPAMGTPCTAYCCRE